MNFISHFWKLLALKSVEVIVAIQPNIECYRYPDNNAGRKKLAEDCYNRVLGKFFDPETSRDDDEESDGPALLSS